MHMKLQQQRLQTGVSTHRKRVALPGLVPQAAPSRQPGSAAQPACSTTVSSRVRVKTAQLTAAPTLDNTSRFSTADAPATEADVFSWTKAWYPAMCIDNLDPDKPNKFQLLGKEYIVWADSAGKWHCFLDRCPHRLATLSDGFIDKTKNEVVCAYHGWRFESSGSCSSIPQALDPKAAETACASQRSCATVFPTQEAGGLLWVWPDESRDAAAQAQAAPLPLLPDLLSERVSPLKGRWFQRDLPYSWDFFMENVLDPTHVDYAHHGVAGYDAAAAVPLDLKLVEDKGPAGFVFQTLPADPTRRGIYGHFTPPSNVTLRPGADPQPSEKSAKSAKTAEVRPNSENPDVCTTLVFYAYPSKPGWTRLYGTSWVTDSKVEPLKSFSLFATAMPPWIKHVLGFEFFAGDDVFLGAAAKAYAAEGQNWRRSYYLPTSADLAIMKMRQWLDKYSGGKLPFPKHMQGDNAILSNLDITQHQAMDRYTQHVQHCSECKAALKNTQTTANAAAIAAVASVVGACLVASIRATAALSPGSVPAWLCGVVSWGCPGVLGLTGPLVLLGLFAASVYFLAKKLEGLFHYREFVRPVF